MDQTGSLESSNISDANALVSQTPNANQKGRNLIYRPERDESDRSRLSASNIWQTPLPSVEPIRAHESLLLEASVEDAFIKGCLPCQTGILGQEWQ
jgi:hypothetical protein